MTTEHQDNTAEANGLEIAVVGMAGRFPGANSVEQYWANLRSGVESIVRYTDAELRQAGVAESQIANPNYIKSGAPLENMEMFDAAFFGFSPHQAEIMDPQHRHFLECVWEALEDAACDPENYRGSIGIFGGSGHNSYMPYNLFTNPEIMNSDGFFLVRHTGNDKDFLTTRVSYELNLRGPSVNVQTACSTSLVAIHMACQSLISNECDLALAGGVTIEQPHRHGYLYQDGEILSPDGHCRAFDADSKGTIFGSGVGVVALKRLSDALADRDMIHAVVKGSAINNDGSMKAGYLAPSVDGQSQVVAEALAVSEVDPETISYIETHGTGTPIGDPIEIAALTDAFRSYTDKKGFCGIGSVKTNIGHLDTAAGVASFIKAVLALKHKEIPASLNFSKPNPEIDFDNSPFFVNSDLCQWETSGDLPRRCGVSSIAVGGTNAHLILEEAQVLESSECSRPYQLLTISGKTLAALEDATGNLLEKLEKQPDLSLADVCYTQLTGRRAFQHRRTVACRDLADAVTALKGLDSKPLLTESTAETQRPVAFMFAGGGAQYPDMGRDLYQSEAIFRQEIDHCLSILKGKTAVDLFSLLYPEESERNVAAQKLESPSLALPALFTIQYSLAKLWISWGIEPTAMIGHSMGEYTAACLAGVFSLEDALAVVLLRGKLFETVPEGGMVSVNLSAEELKPYLSAELSLGAINGPSLCMISGPLSALAKLEERLDSGEIDYQRLHISVAAHSAMLEPILVEFGSFLENLKLESPKLPFVSNLTGRWISNTEATDPQYWVKHLRNTVRFADGLSELLEDEKLALLEVGPGRTLSALAGHHPKASKSRTICTSLRHPQDLIDDNQFMTEMLATLYRAGVSIDWQKFYEEESRRSVSLPTYPFARKRHWVEPGSEVFSADAGGIKGREFDISKWFYKPEWVSASLFKDQSESPRERILLFADTDGFSGAISKSLQEKGHSVTEIVKGATFCKLADRKYEINPSDPICFSQLVSDLEEQESIPQTIVHCWALTKEIDGVPLLDQLESKQGQCFFSLLYLAQAFGKADIYEAMKLFVVSNQMQQLPGDVAVNPVKALLLGPTKVIASEYPDISSASIDISCADPTSKGYQRAAEQILTEISHGPNDEVVAYRGSSRFVQQYSSYQLPDSFKEQPGYRDRGVYLITGGLGGLGLVFAESLAKKASAPKLVLLGRSKFPERSQWQNWLSDPDAENRVSEKIRKILELENLGAEVLVLSADVTDLNQMAQVVEQIHGRFGALNGVLHTAGVLNDGLMQLKLQGELEQILAPKVQGTLVLDQVLREIKLDFLVLFSSVSSFLGIAGQVDYASANSFLDSFARYRSEQENCFTLAVNWNAWQEAGMAAQLLETGKLAQSDAQRELSELPHPVLEGYYQTIAGEEVYLATLDSSANWILNEHRLKSGEAILPGTAYLELVYAAFTSNGDDRQVEFQDLLFVAPFIVRDGEPRQLRIKLLRAGSTAEFLVTAQLDRDNLDSEDPANWGDVFQGTIRFLEHKTAVAKPSEIESRCKVNKNGKKLNDQHAFVDFGPRFLNINDIRLGSGEAFMDLSLAEEFESDCENYALHPALLDMATAGALELIEGYNAATDFYVPISYSSLVVSRPLPAKICSHIILSGNGATTDVARFDVKIMDLQGNELLSVSDFMLKRVEDPAAMVSLIPQPSMVSAGSLQGAGPSEAFAEAVRNGIKPDEGTQALSWILASEQNASQVVISSQNLAALFNEHRKNPALGSKNKQPEVNLSELEDVLTRHQAVTEAAIAANFDRLGDLRIVAYYVANPEEHVTVSELRRFMKGELPDELVPTSFVELEVLPREENGAVDRNALPDPFSDENDYEPPKTHFEKSIAKIWSKVLGIEKISQHDNFMDIGGHSLLAIRVLSRIKKDLGIFLEPPVILLQTLEGVAAECERRSEGNQEQEVVDTAPQSLSSKLVGAVKQTILGA